MKRRKLVSANSLVVIYSSASKIASNSTRTLKERLFAGKTTVTRDRQLYEDYLQFSTKIYIDTSQQTLSIPKCEVF